MASRVRPRPEQGPNEGPQPPRPGLRFVPEVGDRVLRVPRVLRVSQFTSAQVRGLVDSGDGSGFQSRAVTEAKPSGFACAVKK